MIKNNLICRVEVRKSPIHQYGNFAKEDIKANDIIEECVVPTQCIEPKYEYMDGQVVITNIDTMSQYRFTGPTDEHYWIIPAGNALTYNHSFEENCKSYHDTENRLLVFQATKDIKQGEEVLWNYGPKYKYNRITKRGQRHAEEKKINVQC